MCIFRIHIYITNVLEASEIGRVIAFRRKQPCRHLTLWCLTPGMYDNILLLRRRPNLGCFVMTALVNSPTIPSRYFEDICNFILFQIHLGRGIYLPWIRQWSIPIALLFSAACQTLRGNLALGQKMAWPGIFHQPHTCPPWDSATDLSPRVETKLPLELQTPVTQQPLTKPCWLCQLRPPPRRGCGFPFCLLDKPSIITCKAVDHQGPEGRPSGRWQLCLFPLSLECGQIHSQVCWSTVHSDRPVYSHTCGLGWLHTAGYLQLRCSQPDKVKQGVSGTRLKLWGPNKVTQQQTIAFRVAVVTGYWFLSQDFSIHWTVPSTSQFNSTPRPRNTFFRRQDLNELSCHGAHDLTLYKESLGCSQLYLSFSSFPWSCFVPGVWVVV